MSKPTPPTISVSFQLHSILMIILLGAAAYVAYLLSDVVISFFLALIVMSALYPAVQFLEKKLRVPRIAAILFCYCGVLVLLSLVSAVIIPPLMREFPHLVSALNLPPVPKDLLEMRFTSLSEIGAFAQQLFSSFGAAFSIIASTFNGIFTFFTVLVMGSYLLLEREELYKKIGWFTTNPRYFSVAKTIIDQMGMQLGGWVRGEVLLMLTIGVMTYVGLLILQVPYALPLAFLAGFLEILPNLGPTLSAVPALAIAYVRLGPGMMVMVLALYILIQQLENNLVVPKIMKDNVDVNPLTTIVVILSGFKLGGILGALISVPVYVTLRVIYSAWFHERRSK